MQTEPQQYSIGEAAAAVVAPSGGRCSDLGRRRFAQVAVESAAVSQDRLGAHGRLRALSQDLFECRCVVTWRIRGLFGHLFEADHLMRAVRGHLGDLCHLRDAVGVAGVDQPVADAGCAQKDLRQPSFGVLAAAFPIVLRLSVLRETEQRSAVSTHGEAQLRVESRVEVGERLDVGLVEGILKPRPIPR